MVSKEIVITNAQGLHARPATLLVQKATCYKSEVIVINDGKEANSKSLIGILSLGINEGDTITVQVKGTDENKALEEIITLISSF